jgi:7-cyano-7-deazaguanine synthase in queuosine biosynthesis
MPSIEQNEFKFPDEIDDKVDNKQASAEPEIEFEIEDDTPPEDRNKAPMPKPLVEELEKDELDSYDDTVKEKLKQMRKVWHDERREKEAALREQQEALAVAQRLIEENKRIKGILTNGEKEYVSTVQRAAQLELDAAKRAYKEAYDAGDTDKVIEAQQAMQQANIKVMQAQNFKMPSLQEEEFDVQTTQQVQPARRTDPKAEEWQERNPWFGPNKSMTAYALGLHEELKANGVSVGSDEYYGALDKTMRKRFPEAFATTIVTEEEEQTNREPARTKPATVVAPATRSTSPQKVKLKQSQLNIIKKLGITPEQYVKEFVKEARNG